MADIRINALTSTAGTTASDDYLAVDGSANGTRKLSAYSPVFGGNLTVSGTSALNGTVNTNGAKAVNVTPTMTPLSGNLYGLYVYPTINSGASAGGTVSGLTVAATNSGTSNVTNIAGIEFIGGNGAASGSMQDLKAFRSSPINLSTGQIVNLYQFYATNAYNPSGTINTQYGLYVDALTSATTNYAIYTAGTAPSVLGGNLTVSGATRVSDGTAAAPSLAPSSATTTGFYKYNASALGFSSSGSHSLLFGTDGTIYGANLASTLSMPAAGGATLTAGGTNQNITLTPSGTGIVSINRGLAASATGTAFIVQTTDASSLSLFAELEGNATSASRYVTLNSYMGGGGGGRNLVLNRYGGNLLIGTTTDGGQKLQVSGSAAFTGVLTVSGTSGNTFNAGTIVTPTITSQVNQAFRIISTSTAEVQQGFLQTGNFGYYIQVGGSSSYPLMLQPAGSNVLIGTTTDSSNGKIQLATHTTSAGGIGFGTADSFYTAGVGDFRFKTTSAEATVTLLSGGAYIGSVTAGKSTFIISGTGSTALTLDSSQRTFTASAAKIGSLTGTVDSRLHVYESTAVSNSNGLTLEQASTGDSLISFLLTGVQRWSVGIDNSDSDKFKIGTGDLGAADKFTVDTNGDASLAGTIATQGGTASTPANAFATGTAGTIRWDASYIYVCTAANTWKRAAIAAW